MMVVHGQDFPEGPKSSVVFADDLLPRVSNNSFKVWVGCFCSNDFDRCLFRQ